MHLKKSTNKMNIRLEDVEFIQSRQRDEVGEVFSYEGRLFRGVFQGSSELVRYYFESGFIREIVAQQYFPPTHISEFTNAKYAFILEHEKVSPILYPQEWSYSMLKDAAIMVLKVAEIARRYGLNMKDCHGLNVLFKCNKPIFVDLGSFHFNSEGISGWEAHSEFLCCYFYPLFIWSNGCDYTAKLSIFSANLTPHTEHYIYKYRFLRYLSSEILKVFIRIRFIVPNLANLPLTKINKFKDRKLVMNVLKISKLLATYLTRDNQDLLALRKRINALTKRETDSDWKSYHDVPLTKSNRFDEIIEIINVHAPDALTAIDIAGNQGRFARALMERSKISQVICQDLDEQAIDSGYKKERGNHKSDKRLIFTNYNSMAPILKSGASPPWQRFKSDMVISLALLHHLILTQGYSPKYVLSEFAKYTRKYACIEFMPKGLWIKGGNVSVPDYYSVDWFREYFKNYFSIIEERQVGENYIVFLGIKKSTANKDTKVLSANQGIE